MTGSGVSQDDTVDIKHGDYDQQELLEEVLGVTLALLQEVQEAFEDEAAHGILGVLARHHHDDLCLRRTFF